MTQSGRKIARKRLRRGRQIGGQEMNPRVVVVSGVLALSGLLMSVCIHGKEQFESKYFQTSDDVTLHYLEAGSGPTIVFVPGWTMPAEIWEHQLRYFSDAFRVVALDPRGQGLSEKVAHGYYASRRARDIRELIDHIGGEPAVVAGWSLAMQEVLVMTQEQGTKGIRAVVLVDYAIDFDATQMTSRYISMQTERDEWMREFVRAMYRNPQSDEYLEGITRASLSTPVNATAIMIGNLILMGPTDLRPALDSLDRPALFIASSQDWAVEQARMVQEGWPDIHVEIIEDTGHALFADKPGEFNEVLQKFIETLPEL